MIQDEIAAARRFFDARRTDWERAADDGHQRAGRGWLHVELGDVAAAYYRPAASLETLSGGPFRQLVRGAIYDYEPSVSWVVVFIGEGWQDVRRVPKRDVFVT
jgi:hypothetical protein